MLHSDPNTCSKYRQNQAEGASRRPEQEQAQEREYSRDRIKHNHNLPVRHTALKKFVVNVLTVGSKNWPAADEPAQDRE